MVCNQRPNFIYLAGLCNSGSCMYMYRACIIRGNTAQHFHLSSETVGTTVVMFGLNLQLVASRVVSDHPPFLHTTTAWWQVVYSE